MLRKEGLAIASGQLTITTTYPDCFRIWFEMPSLQVSWSVDDPDRGFSQSTQASGVFGSLSSRGTRIGRDTAQVEENLVVGEDE